jgi:RNA polymerase sigma-70 factor (ECF subfamily)
MVALSQSPSPAPLPPLDPQPPLDAQESAHLIQRARAGDDAAFGALFSRCHDRVLRIVRLRMGSQLRSSLESADLVQDTYAAALRGFPAFRGDAPQDFLRWLARIAENQVRDCVDHLAAQRRAREREVPLDALAPGSNASGSIALAGREPSPSEQAAYGELREVYDACVAELPERQREVVLLRDYECQDWGRVAEELACSAHAAQQLYHRAQLKLAERLEARWPNRA